MDDFIKQIEWRKSIEYATSKAGSAVELQSIYIETFPLSGCNKLGFPSSACSCVANISWLVKQLNIFKRIFYYSIKQKDITSQEIRNQSKHFNF